MALSKQAPSGNTKSVNPTSVPLHQGTLPVPRPRPRPSIPPSATAIATLSLLYVPLYFAVP
jgi:hypothetical protein